MQIKSFVITALLAIAAITTSYAQRERTVGGGLSGIWGGPKYQYANFGESSSLMRGGSFGFEFGKSLYAGWSHYKLIDDLNWDQLQTQPFEFASYGGNLGYAFKSYKAIHPILTLDVGRGRIRSNGSVDRVLVMQPSAGVEVNIFRWLHMNVEGGYRFVGDTNIEGLDDSKMSGAFGQVSFRFGWSWGRHRDCRKHSNKQKD
jgi:hypothetical protein